MEANGLYPYALEPQTRELIWGGHALVGRFHKPGDPQARIGETWECWDTNRILNGPRAGQTVAGLREELGTQLTGKGDPKKPFPLLTKIIDARHALSVQVHPPDDYAQRVEKQPYGKTECWYVLDAEPHAHIVLGWNRATSRGEYVERVKEGQLEGLLRRIPVKAGDAYYLPAGTLHAIGPGIILYEVQQASDLTYRIYDYDRVGADGKKRELHVDKAADVLNYYAETRVALNGITYRLNGLNRTALVAGERFIVERVEATTTRHGIDLEGMPLVVMALDEPIELEARGQTLQLEPYATALVPAALDVVMLSAQRDGVAVMTAAPPSDPYTLERRFDRAGLHDAQFTEFFAQF